jgi:hypothetical protein
MSDLGTIILLVVAFVVTFWRLQQSRLDRRVLRERLEAERTQARLALRRCEELHALLLSSQSEASALRRHAYLITRQRGGVA